MKKILMPSEVKKSCHESGSRIKAPIYTVFCMLFVLSWAKTYGEQQESNFYKWKQQLSICLGKQFIRENVNHNFPLIACLGNTILIHTIGRILSSC